MLKSPKHLCVYLCVCVGFGWGLIDRKEVEKSKAVDKKKTCGNTDSEWTEWTWLH